MFGIEVSLQKMFTRFWYPVCIADDCRLSMLKFLVNEYVPEQFNNGHVFVYNHYVLDNVFCDNRYVLDISVSR